MIDFTTAVELQYEDLNIVVEVINRVILLAISKAMWIPK
jgi:hypothetical protein